MDFGMLATQNRRDEAEITDVAAQSASHELLACQWRCRPGFAGVNHSLRRLMLLSSTRLPVELRLLWSGSQRGTEPQQT